MNMATADIISAVEFNHDGSLLATGDKGGRIVIFQQDCVPKDSPYYGEYNVYSTFQSHEPEFDYLKSLDIDEKINKIAWLKRRGLSNFILSTNDKTVKLWKICQRNSRIEGPFNTRTQDGRPVERIAHLTLPTVQRTAPAVCPVLKRVFANAHTYHINSISVSSDDSTYLSADDLRINLWNLERTEVSFNAVDTKPANMEDLAEVITTAEFHPKDPSVFVYCSSKGATRLCDLRVNAICDQHLRNIKFSHSGRYFATRDYLKLKIWDMNMDRGPVQVFTVHDYLRSKLCNLYEADYIFDKFGCTWSPDDGQIMTGSYHNFVKIFSLSSRTGEVCLEANCESTQPKQMLKQRRVAIGNKRKKDDVVVESLDLKKKIQFASWHPKENILALAATNLLYTFSERSF